MAALAGNGAGQVTTDEIVHGIVLSGLNRQEIALMRDELANLGDVLAESETEDSLSVRLQTTLGEEDIVAVLCFVLEPEQIGFTPANAAGQDRHTTAVAEAVAGENAHAGQETAAASVDAPAPVARREDGPQMAEASWRDVQLEDPLGIEVGYRLIPMVDALQNGELLGRIRSIRKKFAQEMGFLPPVVHIRDNLEMQPAAYRILLKGVEIGRGEAFPGRWMAINPGNAEGALSGDVTRDPAFGLPAVWIDSALKERAQIQGYTVVEASSVVATHLNHLIGKYASELLGRQETQQLLERVLLQALQNGGGMEPGMADRLLAQAQSAVQRQESLNAPLVLLVAPALRPLLARFLRRALPQLAVLSTPEIGDERRLRMTAVIGGQA